MFEPFTAETLRSRRPEELDGPAASTPEQGNEGRVDGVKMSEGRGSYRLNLPSRMATFAARL